MAEYVFQYARDITAASRPGQVEATDLVPSSSRGGRAHAPVSR